jgi:hypothetical protein
MNHFVMMQMEILLKFEEMCQDITKEFSALFSKVKYYLIADRSFIFLLTIYICCFLCIAGWCALFGNL